jgi:hypothetical protein
MWEIREMHIMQGENLKGIQNLRELDIDEQMLLI